MSHHAMKAVLVLMTAAGTAGAQPLAVYVSHTIKVDPEDAKAFEAVCQREFAKEPGAQVVSQERVDAAAEKEANADAVARAVGASGYVSIQLIRLAEDGTHARTILTAGSAAPGSPASEVEISLSSLAEAPEVCSRLARAVTEHVSLEQTQTKDNVISDETGSHLRTHADQYGGVKTGLGLPLGQGSYQPFGELSGVAFFERDRYFFEVGAGVLVPSSANSGAGTGYGGLTSELGASYFLGDGTLAPFVGGGVEPRLIFSGAVLNFAPYAQLGFTASRQSRNRFFAELRVAQNLLAVADTSSGTNGSALPTELTVYAGLTF